MWAFLCFFWQISIPAHLCTETYLPLPEHASILAGGRRWNQPRHNKNWSPLVGPRLRPAPGCWRTLKIHESTCGHKNYDCQGPKRARISTGGSRVDRPLASTMLHNEKGTTRKNKRQNKNNTAHENSANKTKQKEKQSPSQNPLGKKTMIMSTFPLYATCPLLVCQGQQNVKNTGGFGVCPTIQRWFQAHCWTVGREIVLKKILIDTDCFVVR